MKQEELIAFFTKFRWIDKYTTFSGILPDASYTCAKEKELITCILDNCANSLSDICKQHKRVPKTLIKQTISLYMDELARAAVSATGKDFGYELCWYMAEKAGVNLRKSTDAKIWGYWKVESGKVKVVTTVRKKRTEKAV